MIWQSLIWWLPEQGLSKDIRGLVGSMVEGSWGSNGRWETMSLAGEGKDLRLGSTLGQRECGSGTTRRRTEVWEALFRFRILVAAASLMGISPSVMGIVRDWSLSHCSNSLGLLFFPKISFTSAWKPKESLLSYSWLIKQIQTYAQPHSAFSLRWGGKCGRQVCYTMQKVVSVGVGQGRRRTAGRVHL